MVRYSYRAHSAAIVKLDRLMLFRVSLNCGRDRKFSRMQYLDVLIRVRNCIGLASRLRLPTAAFRTRKRHENRAECIVERKRELPVLYYF